MNDFSINKKTVGFPVTTAIIASCFGIGVYAGGAFAAAASDVRSSITVSAYSGAQGTRGADGQDGADGADGEPGRSGSSSVRIDVKSTVNGETREVHESRTFSEGTVRVDVSGASSSVTTISNGAPGKAVAPGKSVSSDAAKKAASAAAAAPISAGEATFSEASPPAPAEARRAGLSVRIYSMFNAVVAYVSTLFR